MAVRCSCAAPSSPAGGFLEFGETVEEGARREAEEEVGLSIQLGPILGAYTRPDAGIVVVVFRGRAPEGEPRAGEEALEVRWFSPEAIPWDELAFPTTVQALRDWVSKRRGEGSSSQLDASSQP